MYTNAFGHLWCWLTNSLLHMAHILTTVFKFWKMAMAWPGCSCPIVSRCTAMPQDTWLLTGRAGGSLIKGKLSKGGK